MIKEEIEDSGRKLTKIDQILNYSFKYSSCVLPKYLIKFRSLPSLEPDCQVDHAVGRAEGGAEPPAAHRRHDERHGQDEQGAEQVHHAQVADQDKVDRAEL